jgi:hypothetical protein
LKCGFQNKVCASKSPTFFSRKPLAAIHKENSNTQEKDMGVTIHFEGKLKSETDYNNVIEIAKNFSIENSLEFSEFENENATLYRVKNENDWDYIGSTKGMKIILSEFADPLLLEFDKDLYIQEYCKTQFATIDTHIVLVDFLESIEKCFEKLIVTDEGEYWETKNVELLQEHFDNVFELMEKAKMENPNLDGPYRGEDERIIDLM